MNLNKEEEMIKKFFAPISINTMHILIDPFLNCLLSPFKKMLQHLKIDFFETFERFKTI